VAGCIDVPPPRLQEVDLLKAVGAAAVVLIHAMRGPFEPGASELELRLGDVTRFAVPAFLFASGALAARSGRDEEAGALVPGRRLVRLLLPYLLASIAAEVYLAATGRGPSTGSVVRDLLLGAAFGPYYYVFVALPLVLLEPVARRLGVPAIGAIAVGLLAGQAATEALIVPLPLFWHLRSPLMWWAYWFVGALYGRRRAAIASWLGHGRNAAAGAFVAASLAAASLAASFAAPELSVADRLGQWLAIYPVLSGLLCLGFAAKRIAAGRLVSLLSTTSYTIYLWHLFAVEPVRQRFAPPPQVFEPMAIATPWAAGLLLPLLLALVARRTLGKASARRWLGA
jgi:surface polysaccharide O-acyltransferase-like enzyme